MTSPVFPAPMSADELRKWLARHELNTYTGGPALGISRRQLMRLLAGEPISPTIALLCDALDVIES